MSADDFYKKHLDEIEISGDELEGAKRALGQLREHPGAMNRAEPPAGYEGELLASLRLKLPLETKPAASRPPRRPFEFGLMKSPAFSWSVTGLFALAALITVKNYQPSDVPEDVDLLAQTARKGGADVVDAWLAQTGDTSVQRRIAMSDTDSAAQDLAAKKDHKSIELFLKEMARSMGMK